MSVSPVSNVGLLVSVLLLGIVSAVEGQLQASPKSTISTVIDGATLEVEYHRPSARGRDLFGDLVPWDAPWTPGANWATVLRVDRDARINGVEVPAGEYSLWMIPHPTEFTLSLDPEPVHFHALKPDSSDAQIHIAAAPVSTEHTEMLTWRIPSQRGNGAVLEFAWGETSLPYEVVVQPSAPRLVDPAERQMYVGTYSMTFMEGFGLPETAELEVFEEDGKLRARLPFPLHPDDEVEWDLVPAGRGSFNPGLYRGDDLFTIEMGVNVDFDLAIIDDRVEAIRFSTPTGLVWAEGVPAG